MAATIALDETEADLIRQLREEKEQKLREIAEQSESVIDARSIINGSHRHANDSLFSPIEVEHAKVLRGRYGNSIHSITLAPGMSSSGLGPRIILVKPDAKLQGDDAFNLKAPFLTTMMVPLELKPDITPDTVRETYRDKLVDFVSRLSPSSPSIRTHYHESRDSNRWAPFFPSRKAHIGFYFKDGRHYMIASTHAGDQLAVDLRNIANEPEMTAHRLVHDPRVNWIRRVSQRNCGRVLHEAAQHLGLSVSYSRDIFAAEDGILAAPTIARPCHRSVYNSLDMHHTGNVALYHGVHHERLCAGSPLTHGGHFHGYVSAHHETGTVTTVKHHRTRKHCHKKHKVARHCARVHHLRVRDSTKGERSIETHHGFPKSSSRYRTTFVVSN